MPLYTVLIVAVVAAAVCSVVAVPIGAGGPLAQGEKPKPHEDGVVRRADDGSLYAVMVPPFKNQDNHASQILQLADGTLLIAWFSGPGEDQSGTGIVLSRIRTDGTTPKLGDKWSDAVMVSQRKGYSNQNPVLYVDAGGELHLFHSTMKAGAGEENAQIMHLVAEDADGTHWGKPEVLFGELGSMPKNKAITSLKGGIIFPMYMQEHGDFPLVKTNDHEHGTGSWKDDKFPGSGKGDSCNGRVQPTTVRLVPGMPKLLSYLRDRDGKHIYASSSDDDGKTWSPCKKTGLPNNNSGIQMIVLSNGHLALVFNPTTKANGSGRNILSIAISKDQGDSWPHQRILEQTDSGQYSYPTLVSDKDDNIHISYTFEYPEAQKTIKYRVVTEEWVKSA